jgi:hypothetical protein
MAQLSCHERNNEIPLYRLDGTRVTFSIINNSSLNAYVFLSPECPLSEASLIELNRLDSMYNNRGYATNIIIPGKLYSTEEIDSFKTSFNITLPIYIDKYYKLCDFLEAFVTPEYFLLDKNRLVLYQGAMDDRAIDNDIVKQIAKSYYAHDAIQSILNNQLISITKTKAVGCYIER